MKKLSWQSVSSNIWDARIKINGFEVALLCVRTNNNGLFDGRLFFMGDHVDIQPQNSLAEAKLKLEQCAALHLQLLVDEIEENLKMLTTLCNSENDDPVMLCVKE